MSTESTKGLDKLSDRLNDAFDVERLPFRRKLTDEEINKLRKACSLAFNEDIHPQIIKKIMHYCYYVERNMIGRAAGSIEDLVIRYLIRYYGSLLGAGSDRRRCHLEIGALFGAATIFSCHAVKLAEKEVVTIVVDPFEGYYDEDVDVVTKKRVDEKTFWANIDKYGFRRDMVEIMKGLSTDGDIIRAIKELEIASLFIDGNHSYDGVKSDWMNFSPQVVQGGYVLFDDYNSTAWPEVAEFVNKEVLSNLLGKWEVVLVYGNSIVLKRVDVEQGEGLTASEVYYHKLRDRERTIEQMKREMHEMKTEMHEMKRAIQRINREVETKRERIDAIHNTWSWRITSPLRYLGKRFMVKHK